MIRYAVVNGSFHGFQCDAECSVWPVYARSAIYIAHKQYVGQTHIVGGSGLYWSVQIYWKGIVLESCCITNQTRAWIITQGTAWIGVYFCE